MALCDWYNQRMSGRPDIFDALRRLMPNLRAEFGVHSLGVFGSAARGDGRSESDVDVLVRFEPEVRITLFTLARLQQALEDALGTRVDLIEDHPYLRPVFRRTIERDLRYVA